MWASEVRMITNLRGFVAANRSLCMIAHVRKNHQSIRPFVPFASSTDANAASISEASTPASTPQLPLSERPANHASQLRTLLAWHREALLKISFVGDAWAIQDDGPSQEDLQTELRWLLDDAVAGCIDMETGISQNDLNWRTIEKQVRLGTLMLPDDCNVKLRESLDNLVSGTKNGADKLWSQRLEARVPLQYLTSAAYWRDFILSVGPGVLIPRPETELIIDFVMEALKSQPELAQGDWVDLGTGSGALAIGVASVTSRVKHVWAVDAAVTPALYAEFNSKRLGVDSRVSVVRGSWLEPIKEAGVRKLAGIVSNPPYIPATDMPNLQAEVGRHEPRLALSGGKGLAVDCLTPICIGAAEMLQSGGFLALETNGGEQAEFVADMLRGMNDGATFTNVAVRKDLRQVDRFVTATRI